MYIFAWLLILILISRPLIYCIGNVVWLMQGWRNWQKYQKYILIFFVGIFISILFKFGFFIAITTFVIWRIVWRLESKIDSKISMKQIFIWSISFLSIFAAIYFLQIFKGSFFLLFLFGFFVWWQKEKNEHRGTIIRKEIFKTFVLPIYIYLMIFSFLYSYYCEEYRQVNGIGGDYWHVPLGNGYSFNSIDALDEGDISNINHSNESLISGIIKINSFEKDIFVQRENKPYLLMLNIESGLISEFEKGSPEWNKNKIELLSTHEFYSIRRWRLIDKVIFYFTLIPIIIFIMYWWRKSVVLS